MSSPTITLTSNATVGFHHAVQTGTPMPNSYVLDFTMTQTDWMAVVRYVNANDFWIIGCNGSGNVLIYKWNGSVYTQVAAGNHLELVKAASRVQVMFSELRYGTISDVWHVAALWCNGLFMGHYAEKATAALTGDHYFGFAIRENLIRTFNTIHIPELTDLAEVCTIDPSENALSALQRTIEGRNIKYLMRPNGALKAFKPRPVGVSYSITGTEYDYQHGFSPHQIKSHVRMLGAYDQAEYSDPALSKKYGYRFIQLQNPFLMNQKQCLTEARLSLLRIQERATNDSMKANIHHFLEIEDRVITRGGDRLVSSIGVNYLSPAAPESLSLRKYVYG